MQFFPDYIERFGMEDYAVAVGTMERLTAFLPAASLPCALYQKASRPRC